MRARGIVGQEISEFKEISPRSMPGDSSDGNAPEEPGGPGYTRIAWGSMCCFSTPSLGVERRKTTSVSPSIR